MTRRQFARRHSGALPRLGAPLEHITVLGMVRAVARMLVEEFDRRPGGGRSLRVALDTPNHVRLVEALPRNLVGKVLKEELRRLERERAG